MCYGKSSALDGSILYNQSERNNSCGVEAEGRIGSDLQFREVSLTRVDFRDENVVRGSSKSCYS